MMLASMRQCWTMLWAADNCGSRPASPKSNSAIMAYETVVEHHPNEVAALKMLGNLLWKNGQISEAHATFDKAVRVNPQDQEAIKARKNLAAEASLKETGFETARSSRDLVRDKDAAGKLEQETQPWKK